MSALGSDGTGDPERRPFGAHEAWTSFDNWTYRLTMAVAMSDLANASHALVGGQHALIEADRLAVVELLDEGIETGLSDDELTAAIRAARADREVT